MSANIPWRVMLREKLCFPCVATRRLEFAPLAREAPICLGVLIVWVGYIRGPRTAADSKRDVIKGNRDSGEREACDVELMVGGFRPRLDWQCVGLPWGVVLP